MKDGGGIQAPEPELAGVVLQAIRNFPIVPLDEFTRGDPFLVLAPHPDDDALGIGGLIAGAAAAGHPVIVTVLTDGSGSHASRTYPPARLAQLRRREAEQAARELGLSLANLLFFNLTDGRLPSQGRLFEAIVDTLEGKVRELRVASIMVTWEHDTHPDHQAASRIARAVHSRIPELKVWSYPVWGWYLDPTAPISSGRPTGFRLDVSLWLPKKKAALAAHVSQMTNLIDDDPTGFHFDDATLAPFLTPFEYLIRTA